MSPNAYKYLDHRNVPSLAQFPCYTYGRQVIVYEYETNSQDQSHPGEANYMIVATRPAPLPVASHGTTWGAIKAQYLR